MKKILVPVISVAVITGILASLDGDDQAQPENLQDSLSQPSNHPVESQYKEPFAASDQNVSINTAVNAQQEQTHIDHRQLPSASKALPWQIGSNYVDRYQLPPQIHEKIAVSINSDSINSLEKGAQMELVLPDYSKRTATVSEVSYNGASKTLTGQLANDPNSQVIITASRQSVYATVTTASASYSLQSVDGSGIFYKAPPRSQLEDSDSDALIPE